MSRRHYAEEAREAIDIQNEIRKDNQVQEHKSRQAEIYSEIGS